MKNYTAALIAHTVYMSIFALIVSVPVWLVAEFVGYVANVNITFLYVYAVLAVIFVFSGTSAFRIDNRRVEEFSVFSGSRIRCLCGEKGCSAL